MRSERTHWAYRELEERLAGRAFDQPTKTIRKLPEVGTVFLEDRGMRKELDRLIIEELWPAVLEGVKASEIQIYQQANVLKTISTTRSPELTRELIFLLEDPGRPIGSSNRPPWYVRGTLEARSFIYVLTYDLILEFPVTVSLTALTRLMARPELGGLPPTLSIERGHHDGQQSSYCMELSWGRGGSKEDPIYAPESFITPSIRQHLRIIEAMKQLEEDSYETEGFASLFYEILAFYGN